MQKFMSALRLKSVLCRIQDMQWHGILTSEVVFVCEDCSIRWLDVRSGAPKCVNDLDSLIIKKGKPSETRRTVCGWANHPRLLYMIEGQVMIPHS